MLARIADGLSIPRGYLGLSWCSCHDGGTPAPQAAQAAAPPQASTDEEQAG